MTNTNPLDVLSFIKESNNIEDVWDDQSLIDSFEAWQYLVSQPEINPDVIRETHHILMRNQKTLLPEEVGQFRTQEIRIGGHLGEHFAFVPGLIEEWCQKTNELVKNKSPLEWRDQHVSYEKIHPFIDGNGRTGRMFMNWHRLKIDLPILIVKDAEKYFYYDWFNQT